MSKRFRNYLHLLTAAMTFACALHAQAAPVDISIVSGSAWRSTDAAPSGWAGTTFDDSAWSQAFAPYPNALTTPDDIAGEPSAAALMWHWPSANAPDGASGPNEAWFRYTFELALTPGALPLAAQALIIADDEFELFINGQLYDFGRSTALDDNMRSNGQPLPLLVDFASLLRNGTNVLAIHAADNSLANPADRLYEYVYFEGSIATIPEPGSIALLLLALLAMTAPATRAFKRRNPAA